MSKAAKRTGPPVGNKDPTISTSVKMLRALFSQQTIGVLGAALAAQLGRRWVSQRLVGSALDSWAGEAGLVVASAVGYSAGYGGVRALHWARYRLIKSLLTYKGWIFEQSSTKTKSWGLLLKLLVGPGPHQLFEFEESLPELPLPTLEETCKKYLQTVEPLLTAEEYRHTVKLVEDFMKNEGPVLHEYLVKRKKTKRNWLSDWWLATAYLERREPIAVNVNFYMMSTIQTHVSENQLARAAGSLYGVAKYYEMVTQGTLPPDMISGMVPVCMESVQYMLGSCRIPGPEKDSIYINRNSRHAIVLSKGVYYRVDLYTADSRGRYSILSKQELRKQLERIVAETAGVSDMNAVAALTASERTKWYQNRQLLIQDSINAATVKEIESAIFILVLGYQKPKDYNEMAQLGFMGDGTSRWFDKGLTLEVFKDTTMAAANMEHSGADATHFAIMWEHTLMEEEFGPDGDLVRYPGEPNRELPPPKRLEWRFTNELRDRIDESLKDYRDLASTVDLIIYHTKYGKKWMKQQRVSPDGFLQMAIQLAYWRMHGEFTKTYEPASHRLFALGRTDNINPVSNYSVQWVKAMDDLTSDNKTRVKLMEEAIKFQSKVRLEATAGYGSERHLLGLSCAAKDLGLPQPALFKDKAYNLPMKLSTSQVPTNLGSLGLPLVHESTVGGFGPVCPDGYGLLYVGVGDNLFNFNICSWKTCPQTDSTKFSQYLDKAMDDMRDLLESRQKNSVTNGHLNNKL